MSMATTLTIKYEGPPSCAGCQMQGIPLCDHIGLNAESYDHMIGQAVTAPGLDSHFAHVLRTVDISPDRKTATMVVDTERPPLLELARHVSMRLDYRAKAAVRAEHHETGEVLAEGRHFDAFLREGETVLINGVPHVVVGEPDHPNRNQYGIAEGVDLQVAKLAPTPVEPIQIVPGGTSS